jgi:predicted RNA-binding protein YlxR (DUF448 family)
MTIAAAASTDNTPRRDVKERRCILTRESGDAARMVRFVVSPDGQIVPDVDENLPGRGLWLKAARDIVRTAVERGAFAKAAEANVKVSPTLADDVEAALARRSLSLLGFARRAGLAVAGFEKVRSMLGKGKAGVLLASREAAADGRRKLAVLAPGVAEVALFADAELAVVFGRDSVTHAALEKGRIAASFLRECERLQGFRESKIETALN